MPGRQRCTQSYNFFFFFKYICFFHLEITPQAGNPPPPPLTGNAFASVSNVIRHVILHNWNTNQIVGAHNRCCTLLFIGKTCDLPLTDGKLTPQLFDPFNKRRLTL